MNCYSYVRYLCISDGSCHMHKALRTMCGISQTPSHTTVITVIKMRTKRHHVDLASQLLIVLDVEAELALAWDMPDLGA